MAETGPEKTTTVIVSVVVKKKWIRQATGPHHRLEREEKEVGESG